MIRRSDEIAAVPTRQPTLDLGLFPQQAPDIRHHDDSVLICGDASAGLDLLADETVQTVVTSPPYWSLRDYDVGQQLGRDDTLDAYVARLVHTFDKLKRVLRSDGTVWLNVGDVYTSGSRRYRAPDRKNRVRAMSVRPPTPEGLKAKDLIGLPWRIAFLLQEAGWWLRSEVIWHKPNAQPESVRDRPTKSHETVFLFSKSQSYYYNVDAVRGPNGRRLRTVWDIPTSPRRFSGDADHPAVMPMTLARRCIEITSHGRAVVLDPFAGSGTTLIAAQQLGRRWVGIELKHEFVELVEQRMRRNHRDSNTRQTSTWLRPRLSRRAVAIRSRPKAGAVERSGASMAPTNAPVES